MIEISHEKLIVLDNSRFTTCIVDPTVVTENTKIHCMYCQNFLFTMNRKFAVISDGAMPFGGEVPLNVFRFTVMCSCRHYYICYLSGEGIDL